MTNGTDNGGKRPKLGKADIGKWQASLTPEQRSENARRASEAASRKNKARKLMKEAARLILELPLKRGRKAVATEKFKSLQEATAPEKLDVMQAIILKQVERALKGDRGAAEFLRDTSGNRPVEEYEVVEVPRFIDDIEQQG